MKKVLIHLLIVLASIVLVICSCTNEPAVHDHTFSQEWVYDDNFHWHSSTCGHDVVSGKANHVWDEGVVTKEASHTEDGVRTFSCKTCGYTKMESIPAKTEAHTFSEIWSKNETAHWHASTCGHDVVSGMGEHTWDAGVVTKEATHTEDGLKTFICTTCGFSRTEVIPAATDAHTFSTAWSSNTTSHWHNATCVHIELKSDESTHSWDDGVVTKESTHTEDGIRTFTCYVCGRTRTETIPARIDAHSFSSEWTYDDTFHWHSSTCGHDVVSGKANHVWNNGVVTKQATHTEDGILTYTCTTCGKTRTEVIPAQTNAHTYSEVWTSNELGHWHASTCGHDVVSGMGEHTWNAGVVTKEATHTEDGVKTFICTTCGFSRSEVIPAATDSHSFSPEWTYDDTFHWHSSTCGHDVVSEKTNHVWDSGVVTKAATHTEEGILTYTCTTCGRTKTEAIPAAVDAHTFSDAWSSDTESHWHNATCVHIELKSDEATHSWDDGVVTKEASHTEDGVRTFTCSVCGRTRTETIPAAVDAHTFSDTWSSDSDFHWHDATCIHAYLVSEKAAHSWDDGVVTKEATHTENGVMTYTCATCGKTKTEVIPAAVDAHTFSDAWSSDSDFHWHDATCVHTELISGKDAHSWDEGVITLKPTCTEKGEKTYTCSICGKTKIEEVPMKEHAWSTPSVVVAPTCVNPGIVSFLCSDCPATKLEYTPADTENGHNWDNGSVITTAKCTEDGLIRYTCSLCSKTKDEAIPATGHNYKATVTNPTCTKKGFTTHKCSSCGDEYVDSETVALGHTVTHHNRVEPTCTTTGNVEYWSCSRCGNNYSDSAGTTLIDQVLIPATGHSYSEQWTSDADYHWHSSTCGHDVVSGKMNHSWDSGVVTKEASHTEEGVRTYSCTVCGKTRTEVIPARVNDHTFAEEWTSDNTYHWHSSTCGHDVVSGKANHSWDSGVVTKEATHTEEGVRTYSCTVCGKTRTEVIPARVNDHTFAEEWTSDDTYHWHSSTCGHDVVSNYAEHSFPSEWTIIKKNGIDYRYRTCLDCGYEQSYGSLFENCFDITEEGVIVVKNRYSWPSPEFPEIVEIPSSIKGITVTGIDAMAFDASGCGNIKYISIPDTVVWIGQQAFIACTALEEMILPESVKELRNGTFVGSYLKKVYIPGSVSYLDSQTFSSCPWLTDITVSSDNEFFSSADGCLFSKDMKTLITVPAGKTGSYSIPSTVESIGWEALHGCDKITEVNIPDSVKEIGGMSFAFCHGLTCISIPGSVVTIESGAFSGCSGLTEVTIGNGCKEIGQYAFDYCDQLISVIIPDSVEKLGAGVFAYCSRLNDVTIGSSVKEIGFELGSPLFEGCNKLTEIRYNGTTSDWDSIIKLNCCSKDLPVVFVSCNDGKSSLHEWLSIVHTEPTCLEPGKIVYTCSNCDGVYEEILPPTGHSYSTEWSSDETYHWHAATCGHDVVSAKAEHSFPEEWSQMTVEGRTVRYRVCSVCGYKQTYSSIFEQYLNITDDGEISIKKDATLVFPEIVEIPESVNGITVSSIANNAFYSWIDDQCASIKYIYVPDTVKKIGDNAFSSCYYLEELSLPETLEYIGDLIVSSYIETFYIPKSVNSVGIIGGFGIRNIFVNEENEYYSSADGCLFDKDKKTLIRVPMERGGDYVVPAGVETIKNKALSGCFFSSVTIADSVNTIEPEALLGLWDLSEVIVQSGNQYFTSEDGILYSKDKSELWIYPQMKEGIEYSVPDSVTIIHKSALTNDYLRSITIPVSVNKIETQAINAHAIIYCDVETKPSGWEDNWNSNEKTTILWNCSNKRMTGFVGTIGVKGGYIFYDCDADNDNGNADGLISSECGWRFLEAAPEDSSCIYSDNTQTYEICCGYYSKKLSSNDIDQETAIGTGLENTVRACWPKYAYKGAFQSLPHFSISVACTTILVDGVYTRYFLPSKDELDMMYKNLYLKGLGSFTPAYYWSSSERNDGTTWAENFANGTKSMQSKSNYYRVRSATRY